MVDISVAAFPSLGPELITGVIGVVDITSGVRFFVMLLSVVTGLVVVDSSVVVTLAVISGSVLLEVSTRVVVLAALTEVMSVVTSVVVKRLMLPDVVVTASVASVIRPTSVALILVPAIGAFVAASFVFVTSGSCAVKAEAMTCVVVFTAAVISSVFPCSEAV